VTSFQVLGLLAALAPLLPLGIGLYNRRTWPRPRALPQAAVAAVSVLVPARNEARNIRSCLEAILAQGEVVLEVLVYSDESSDETDAIVRSIAEVDGRVRLIVGGELPSGWVGKPHACHELGKQARGFWFLFVDADVRLEAGGICGLLAAVRAEAEDAAPEVVSLVPRQLSAGFWLDVLQPLLLLTYVSWLPLAWANRRSSRIVAAACGQLLLVARDAFSQLDGFAGVRGAVVDDLAFCRNARDKGARVAFLDGHEIANCRMYDGVRSFWRGFAKNVFWGLGSELNLGVALGLHAACFLLPYGVLVAVLLALGRGEAVPSGWLEAACTGVLANLLHRGVLARRHEQGLWSVILHPVAVVVLVVLALDSWRRARLGGIEWSGRSYDGTLA